MEKDKVVLIIDDNQGARMLTKASIEHAGFSPRILMTNSCKDALNVIKSDSKNPNYPNLIFLDLQMPKETGWDFLEQLENLNLVKKTKVVILTTSVNMEDQMKANTFPNVMNYCYKPISSKKIKEIFRNYEENN